MQSDAEAQGLKQEMGEMTKSEWQRKLKDRARSQLLRSCSSFEQGLAGGADKEYRYETSTPLDVQAAAQWVRHLRPRTRLDAAPMLVLATSVLERLLDDAIPKVCTSMGGVAHATYLCSIHCL